MNRPLSRLVSFFLIGAFILTACGSSNTATPTAIRQQITVNVQAAATTAAPPTNTLSPTETPLPTETPTPTESPSPTETPVPAATTTVVVTPTSANATLPVVTPLRQPTQSLNFVPEFYQVEYCTGWTPAFKITNTGSTTLQSYKIEIKDKTAKVTTTTSNNLFDKSFGCLVSQDVPSLGPDEGGFIYAKEFPYDPMGDDITATVTLCSQDNQAGDCETQTINFKP